MSDLIEYKCPACGGAMEFDSETQKMKCPFCDTERSVEAFNGDQQENKGGAAGRSVWEALGKGQWKQGETEGMKVYSCESCGGEIVAEETTGASACPFCGNRVVMKQQFAGDLKPDYIIPFKLDKKAAKAAYHKHLTGKTFLPKIFKKENHIDEIKGVYVPFWLFDAAAEANIRYDAECIRTWENGDTEYTEHEFYQLQRSGSIRFEHIPADCSKKMDDTLMESIEPYHFKDAVPFQTAYLAGYVADRYDVEMEACIQRARERIRRSAEISFRKTVKNYHSVTVAQSRVEVQSAQYWYVLYPVWLLNTTWKEEKYLFAMNGQTGKMVGDLPFDKAAFWKYVAARGVAAGAVIYALMWALLL